MGGVNPDNIYEFDLHHYAQGDTYGNMGDALIAFNLNDLPRDGGDKVTIRLNWRSFTGYKSVDFKLRLRPEQGDGSDNTDEGDYTGGTNNGEVDPASIAYNSYVE